ncbi:MAG: hypothetical protein WBP61_17210, partial [Nocardioides sp.]
MRPLTSSLLAPMVSAALGAALLVPVVSAAPAVAAPARQIDYTQWDAPDPLRGIEPEKRRARWTSPWTSPGFALTRLIASWSARTPGDSKVRIAVRGRTGSTTSSWDTLAIWADGDRFVRRTTRSGQADDLASVNVDTWVVPAGVTSYQLRVTMTRRAGQKKSPKVLSVGAMSSRLPAVDDVATSRT